MNIFEAATKKKLRINTIKGNLSIEQLWDVPMSNDQFSLDLIAQELYKRINKEANKSFVTDESIINENDKLRFDLVLHIIKVRKEELNRAKNAALIKAKKQRIMEAIKQKENEQFNEVSLDELQKMLENL